MQDDKQGTESEEREIARLLKAAGRRPQMPQAMQDDWEAQFRAGLQPVLRARRQRRYHMVAGLCATLAAVAIGLGLLLRQPSAPELLVQVVATEDARLVQADGTDLPLRAGHYLAPGSQVNSSEGGHVAVDYGGYDLRLHAGTRMELAAGEIRLTAGRLYASSEGRPIGDLSLNIRTPQGHIRNIGTQFIVSVEETGTVATVRRGAVEFDTGNEVRRAAAADGKARRLSVDRALRIEESTVAGSGEEWQWIHRGGPDFTLDNKSVWEFLQWVARESGQQLVFASEAAEIRARTDTLHGSLPSRDPERALSLIHI